MAGLLACCFGGPEPGPAESEVKSEAVAAVAAAASKVPAAAQPKEAATPKPPGVPVAAPEPEPEPEEPEEALAMVEEPACGHLYPSFITAYAGAAGRPKQKLVGCGVRSKRIGGNLYTVGVYVAPAGLPSDATVDTLIAADLDETLRFELQSGLINEKRFLGAFDEALKGAMKAAGESDTYEAFRAGLTALTFVPKTVFLMSLAPDGTIVVTDGAGETVITTVASKKLGQLLIDLYVGPKTVAPAVKAAVAQGVAALAKANRSKRAAASTASQAAGPPAAGAAPARGASLLRPRSLVRNTLATAVATAATTIETNMPTVVQRLESVDARLGNPSFAGVGLSSVTNFAASRLDSLLSSPRLSSFTGQSRSTGTAAAVSQPLLADDLEEVGSSAAPLEEEAVELVMEPETGHMYPSFIREHGSATALQHLMGAGCRSKRLVGKLYSVGLYVNVAEAASLGVQAPGDLMGAECGATLGIFIESKLITAARFLDSFDERLKGPMKAAGELATYEQLRAGLSSMPFAPGLDILLCLSKDGRVTAQTGGRVAGEVTSKKLAASLLDIYLGADPVSPGAKAAIARGLAGAVH